MSINDCYFVGNYALQNKENYISISWLETTLKLLQNETKNIGHKDLELEFNILSDLVTAYSLQSKSFS